MSNRKYKAMPTKRRANPYTKVFNSKKYSIPTFNKMPKKANKGNLPILTGALNSLFASGSLYLRTITDRLTNMYTVNIPKSVK